MSRHRQHNYDWFGYGVWFVFGALFGGVPVFVFHVAIETAAMSNWQIIGLLSVCCLGGGLWWGRRHRRQWERENADAELVEDLLESRTDDFGR